MPDTVLANGSDFQSAMARERDTSRPVVLIGFQQMENLGLGYLTSTLRAFGHEVLVFDFEQDPKEILKVVRARDPFLIGLSLIFQLYVPQFRSLVSYLRDHGVDCHFTIGGHFPSLSYDQTLDLIPGLDTVVRFEGELTLLELADCLSTGVGDFRAIKKIAYLEDGKPVSNPLRPLVPNLDSIPYPDRAFMHNTILGRPMAAIVASRGCIRTCSFCSIHVFYRNAPGKVVRTRKPAEVVKEMRTLYDQRGIRIFQFLDDDFPLYGPVWRRWAHDFVSELYRNDLPGNIIWKISCRADAVEPELFAAMRDAGLYMVYMGLESGSEEGLETLNKKITVDQNIRAVEILKELGLTFQYGFMLFEPSTTFESVRQNMKFLRRIVGDGSTSAGFARMIPYDGTPIKDELARQGRLRGDVVSPDYDFLDPKVTEFYQGLGGVMAKTGWIHGIDALSQELAFAEVEEAVMERLFPVLDGIKEYRRTLRDIIRRSNEVLFQVVEDMCESYDQGRPHRWSAEELHEQCQGFMESFLSERNAFVLRHQDTLLEALGHRVVEEQGVSA
jgi:anaerobic magnesium-protoporphyrin IX monomethyl ester cyclase